MSQKTLFIGLMGISIGSLLFTPVLTYADQLYLQYPGNCFVSRDEGYTFYKGNTSGWLEHDTPSGGSFFIPVNFNKSSVEAYFIKSISINCSDSDDPGYIGVTLRRRNFYTNAVHTVASWDSSSLGSPGFIKAHIGTISGYKFVDTQKFSYWLEVYFSVANGNMGVYQVRIHYGT